MRDTQYIERSEMYCVSRIMRVIVYYIKFTIYINIYIIN